LIKTVGSPVGSILAGTVFAAAGWLVTYSTDKVVSVPTIGYEILYSANRKNEVTIRLQNLSREFKFSDLAYVLRLPLEDGGTFDQAAFRSISPADSPRNPIETSDKSVRFQSIGLQPGTQLELRATYLGAIKPSFHVEPNSPAVRLLEQGVLTCVIRNEIEILFVLFVVWIGIVIWALSTARAREGTDGAGSEGGDEMFKVIVELKKRD
jgi:hypothetical protein